MNGPVTPPPGAPGPGDGRTHLTLASLDEPEPLRADAARNRTRLLDAASRLLPEERDYPAGEELLGHLRTG